MRVPAGMMSTLRREEQDDDSEGEPDFDWSWTEDAPVWVAPTVDTKRPSVARMYDYLLGGKDSYEIDRELAQQLLEVVPDLVNLARSNRDFVLRAVRVMAEAGITQFIDLGCGVPSEPTVHDVARDIHPQARVAYIDLDPIVIAHTRALLDGQSGLYAALHDLREPSRVLDDPGLVEVIDLTRPVGLVMGSVLHFVDLAIGTQVVGRYLNRSAPGSHVAFSLVTSDGVSRDVVQSVEKVFRSASSPMVFRTQAQVEELFDGLELLSPGIADVTRWRADGDPGVARLHAGVAIRA